MTFLTNATQLLTLRAPSGDSGPRRGAEMRELGIVEDGAVLIADGKIVAVGTTDEVAKHELFTAKVAHVDEIDCSGKVVLPGFVDSHTHPVFTAPRLIDFEKRIAGASYEEIADAGGGIRASLRGVRDASQETLAAHVLRALDEMAEHGTTTVECKSGYGLNFAAEMKSLEAIREASHQWPGTVAPTLLAAHVVPPEHRENPEEYVRIICEDMIPTAAKLKLAAYVDVFCERGAFTMEQSQRILRTAVDHNLGVRAHVCQLTPAQLAPLLEFHPASLDHLDFISDEDVAALSKLDTVATLLPAANYFLGLESFPPARKLLDAGVAVSLATDYNPGTSPTASMPFVLSVACTHMKMSPAEALVAATYNGACALQLQGRKGSLEPGKDADVAIFDAQDYRELAYWFGINRCRETFLNGIRQAVA
ncbi:MAG TPA: imidazolonepropionase [Terriglobales bacterium]|jgi:imidazolonepropionase